MNTSVIRHTILSAVIFSVLAVAAPTETNRTQRLPEVVVTSTPLIEENRLTPLAGQVTTVTKEQIKELNAQDMPSALRRTPGVVISRHNPIGSFGGADGGTVFIRGMGASRPGDEIVMTMDGIPRFVGVWTHPLMDTLSVDNAARLDVYKGAQPVLFGNMSFGVVDIVTKRQAVPGFHTELQLAYGSYDTWVQTAEHGGKVNAIDYYLIQSFRCSEGHRNNASGELQNYLGRFGYDLTSNWNLSLLYNRTDNWAKDPGDIRTGIHQGKFETTTDFGLMTLANQYQHADGWVKVYWEHGAIDWLGQYVSTTKRNDSDTMTRWDTYGVKMRETFRPFDGAEWMVGLDIDFIYGKTWNNTNRAVRVWTFPGETFRIIQPYAMVAQQFDLAEGIWIKPSAGVRGFFHDEYPNEAGPQAGVVLGVHDTRLHFGYARGVNYPGIYAKAQKAFIPPLQWRNLAAETLDHFEAGIRQDFGTKLRLEVVGFVDNGHNRIVRTVPPPPPPTYLNRGSFDTHGVEVTTTWRPVAELALFVGGTWLEAKPADLPYTPRWSATAGISWRFWKHFTFNMDATYVDRQHVLSRSRTTTAVNTEQVGSYFLLGGRLAYEFRLPWHDIRGELFIAGENLSDASYEYKPGYPMPGINGIGGVRLTF
ncbi:MAG: TonB-dependent receptor plug domain-containing protein [Verrucomicrobiae bacterium]|nr:TonB-dependent receptor plug domain-containing protein [Verrucomicrobiae bacterium]